MKIMKHSIPGCRIDDKYFDMWKYASFYCQQDVKILRLGFNQFGQGIIKDFNIDPFKFISISSLANEADTKMKTRIDTFNQVS